MSGAIPFHAGFLPENVPDAVSALRGNPERPIISRTEDGGQCRIFKADFSNGESWSIRVPIHVRAPRDGIIKILEDEHRVLKDLQKNFKWAPKYRGSSFTFQNAIEFPFLALSWIEGSPLSWTTADPPRHIRNTIMAQLAIIQVSLIESTVEQRGSASQYFSRLVENKLLRVRNGQLSDLSEDDCLAQQALIQGVLIEDLETAPFAIDHGDLGPQNIIVDSNWRIQGIIDWGFASKVPLQMAGRMPRIIQLADPVLPPTVSTQDDRAAYIQTLKSMDSQVASWLLLIYSSERIDFCHCFLESMISKGMHRRLARLGWKLPTGRDDPI